MDCVSCHVNVQSGARATIPNIDVCQDCHSEEPSADKTELKKLFSYTSSNKKIPWRKVYRVDAHIFFSHRRHAVLGNILCETCHGKVGEKMTPVTGRAVAITMKGCMDCHEKRGVANDCLLCHR